MTTSITKTWQTKQTPETRSIEDLLRKQFEQADAYRYNSASIRIRVIDSRFEGMPRDKRDALVEEQIDKLPPETQRDIVTLFTFAPSELSGIPQNVRESMLNSEFDEPSPSVL
jgi:stress-induced morphogen